VWAPEQLAPFVEGGKRCARLITTRVPELAGRGTAVRVDQMSPEQARALLTSGLPPLDPAVVQGLLAVTGRWPLLRRPCSHPGRWWSRPFAGRGLGAGVLFGHHIGQLLLEERAGGGVAGQGLEGVLELAPVP
jgi:hypothetical protein